MPIRPRTALLCALVCFGLLAADWFATFHLGFFQHADQAIFRQFGDLEGHGSIAWISSRFVLAFEPNPYVYLVLVPLVVAMLRRRPRVVLAVGVIILGANVTTEVLKHLLAAPRPGPFDGAYPVPPTSWPSGHSTAVMSLVLASVLAAPARLRPTATALGAVLSIAVGYSLLAAGVHYPSDVLGGFLIAAIWTLVVVAALQAAEHRRPVARKSGDTVSVRSALGAPGAVLVGALVAGAILAVIRPHDVVSYASGHEAFVVGAAAVAALSLVLSTVVLLSLRR